MNIVEEVHLEDWSYEEYDNQLIYTKGRLRVVNDGVNRKLYIKDLSDKFQLIKQEEELDYWEINMYDNFLNSRDVNFEMDFSKYISDKYSEYEYLIIADNAIYGMDNVFEETDSEDGFKFSDPTIEKLYNKGKIKILDVMNDFSPLIYKNKEWHSIECRIFGDVKENRKEVLDKIIYKL
jgi:hypothetical protein